jgi:hypothetical protein
MTSCRQISKGKKTISSRNKMRGNLINTFYKTNQTSDDYSPKTERKPDFFPMSFASVMTFFRFVICNQQSRKKQFTGKIFYLENLKNRWMLKWARMAICMH